MIITLNNRQFNFSNVRLEGKSLKFNDSILKNFNSSEELFTRKIVINYEFFTKILNLSLRSYMHVNDNKSNIIDNVGELFTFFKISNNLNVKHDMAMKIGYLIITNDFLKNDKSLLNMMKEYSDSKNFYVKSDIYFDYLIALLIQENNEVKDSYIDIDEEPFTINDFLIDYYS
mgnify:CR=1 FL=1